MLRPHSEQKMFDKLKRRQLIKLLSRLAGATHGYVDISWKNGSIRYLAVERWEQDILNDALENQDHVGTARYHFGNDLSVKLEYLETP